ncbi:glycolate oxidase subunit GlcE [Curvibacter sp. APW13]|uniref:glycolate oxidase subunit GlcE n=1 Tax=Curvibacter sp. APW13 TaxID=3077236 RepID=UPI0028DEBF2A|nr:glycolate oxidase subunit GlcE [Curvibacter sp. APW13]MDT8990165.1 glycolate oxidase subunit GlcE [Curvibacter sp. APW13]
MDPHLNALIDRIRHASQTRTPLRLRGGGSKDFHGNSLVGEVLDTRGLCGIRAYEPSELVVTVAAGTPLAELEATLHAQGQYLPFEPPHFAWSSPDAQATVGGMVAAGLAGPARATAGSVRDYVLGVQMVNGLGEHLTFGGQVIKNVAGYDVSRLMAGSLGTLGLITEVSLKVLPLPAAEASLVFQADQASALEQLHRWGAQPLPLNASCWVRDDTAPGQPELLFVRLRGASAAVDAACTQMLAELPGQRMDNAVAGPDWEHLRNQSLPFFTRPSPDAVLWRLSLPQTAPVLDLPWPQLVEWQGGLRWCWAPPDAAGRLQAAARQCNGSASVFVADSAHSTRAKGQFDTENSAAVAIARRVKSAFDPHGIFNPHRLYADF